MTVDSQRTLWLPESGLHPLPPGLGRFPLRRVADYPDTAPSEWLSRGGVMLPSYQREAMWLSFEASEPAALQVGAGKVCAVSGLPWIEHLVGQPQNYVALPKHPWLDGINAGDRFIRQFVAVPLGTGATVEGQVTGQETHGRAVARRLRAWDSGRRAGVRAPVLGRAMCDLDPPENLANLTSVGKNLGVAEDPFVPVDPADAVALGVGGSDAVTDGKW
ncbi:hypothetical protein C6A87_015830 [Mycobacterium sp. ITM-2016-00317]|uniref:hypothetical protein n=1 Tax=Mycobacterium sp. ITM-2016-00317 TaxID=2099694 RepID=UPI00287F43D6|nr:hypothetical protein [Mycobacterium sp. ITM-2016-00317]WNG85430.1 hypothetical protein C6A87_015830 [Mycobacterium sp. ITM-2016-00317]